MAPKEASESCEVHSHDIILPDKKEAVNSLDAPALVKIFALYMLEEELQLDFVKIIPRLE